MNVSDFQTKEFLFNNLFYPFNDESKMKYT